VDMSRTGVTGSDGQVRQLLGVTVTRELCPASPGDRLRLSWYNAVDTVRLVWVSLGDLVTGRVGLRELSGVIGITTMIGDEASAAHDAAQEQGESGFAAAVSTIFYITAVIAVNLAVMNLLPIPALDGGQILFLLADKIYSLFTRRRIDQKYLGYINAAGFVLLMGLMIVVACSDILKQFGR